MCNMSTDKAIRARQFIGTSYAKNCMKPIMTCTSGKNILGDSLGLTVPIWRQSGELHIYSVKYRLTKFVGLAVEL